MKKERRGESGEGVEGGGKERENCHKLTTVSNVYSRVFLQNHFSVFLYLG